MAGDIVWIKGKIEKVDRVLVSRLEERLAYSMEIKKNQESSQDKGKQAGKMAGV